jgi:hypothetical protein
MRSAMHARKALAPVAAAVALAALPAAAAAPGAIEDDYPRALAAARERGVPIVVDLWAPW